MDEILSIILKDTYSLTQFNHRFRILKSSLLKTFFGGPGESMNPQDLNWLQSLPEGFYRQFTKDNVYDILGKVERKNTELTLLTMYLTFEPDDTALTQIGAVARKTFGLPFLLLDIKFDPRLIAGAALAWKGVYRDYSLRSKIEGRKLEILQEFKKFLR